MKILIVKTSAAGDIVHTFPVVQYLKKRFPNCEIDWVVEKPLANFVAAHPDVRTARPVATKQWRKSLLKPTTWHEMRQFSSQLDTYDVLFDLQGNIKSGLITKAASARHKVGFEKPAEWPNRLFTKKRFEVPPGQNIRFDYLSIVQQFFRDPDPYMPEPITLILDDEKPLQTLLSDPFFENPITMICPGSAWPNKQISEAALLDFCREHNGHYLWIWGNEEEHLFAQRMHRAFPDTSLVAPKLTIPALQHLMARMNLIITMDSLPLHLAATTATPTLSIFGPSLAAKYQPLSNHKVIQGTCPYGRTFDKRCPILRTCSTGLCTKAITGEHLMSEFVEITEL